MSGPQVVGSASEVEVAAVVAVLASLGGGPAEAPVAARSEWASPRRAVRSMPVRSMPDGGAPGSWRASALPR